MSNLLKNYLKRHTREWQIAINIIVSLLIGTAFVLSKENYLELHVADKIVQILLTSLALYFAVTCTAVSAMEELSRIGADTKRAANENNNLDHDTQAFFIHQADSLIDDSYNSIATIESFLSREVFMIVLVLLSACVKGFVLSYNTPGWMSLCLNIMDNSIIVYSIAYTLYIVLKTSRVFFILHKRY